MDRIKFFDIIHYINFIFWNHFDILYKFYIRYKAKQIRKKDKIKVLFVLVELDAWKTEALYQAMFKHPRFSPVLGVTVSRQIKNTKTPLINYIKNKGYDYVDLDLSKKTINKINPDIILYYKPYDISVPREYIFRKHLKSLCIFINYAFTTMGNMRYLTTIMGNYSWFVFVENILVANRKKELLGRKANNVRVTGIPMQDMLIKPKYCYINPWIDDTGKKRIIYAPHHTVKGAHNYCNEYSTFLELGEFMLKVAEKYKEHVFFAFKPHPVLYSKLLNIWGKKKTDGYYEKWRSMENTQYTPGEYSGLFMYSDAMIHDCVSFQVEYLYTRNPVMFLDAASYKADEQNEFGRIAHNMHYIGRCKQDIEDFIRNVINGEDPMKEERERFYNEYLLPPNNKTASENIIETILGQQK